MAIVYLEPGDLSAAQAARVLAFLNRAESAAQLARDIEFPHEIDIGLRLGQRLLDARAALGGRFTDIAQVRAVKLIGPERFTEICVAALGLDVRRWMELFFAASPMSVPAETGLALSLAGSPQPLWLGQPLMLTLWVRDRAGAPRAGVPVTVHTTFGRLSYAYGLAVSEGAALTATTGADGRAQLALLTPPDEPLSLEQQAALAGALGRLDAQAAHPLIIEEQFLALAQDYALERNYSLRKAIDVYTRQWKTTLVDSLNPGRWRLAWPLESAVVRADAHPPGGGGTSLCHAALPLSWKNWVGPWVEFLAQSLRTQARLGQGLAGAARSGAKGSALAQRLVGAAHGFLAGQAGLSAEWLGRKVVNEAVRDYLGRALAGFDTATQQAVISQLEVAADQLRPASAGTLALVDQTRGELDTKIATVGATAATNLDTIKAIEAGVKHSAEEVATNAAAVAQSVGEFSIKYDKFNVDYQSFDTNYVTFATDYATFSANYTGFTTDYGTFKLELANYRSDRTQFATDLNVFNQNRTQLNETLGLVQTDLAAVKIDVAGLKQRTPRTRSRKKED